MAQNDDGEASSGSVYSQFGVGYPVEIANTAANSMGLSGVSYNEAFVGNLANPAHWGSTVYGLGTGGIEIQSYQASNGVNSVRNTNFSINRFQLQLPLIRGEFGASVSFTPLTQSNFRSYSTGIKIKDKGTSRDTLRYAIENYGKGGVNRAELGFGWHINSNISIGYAASIVYISMDDVFSSTFFAEPSFRLPDQSYQPVRYTLETTGAGMGNRFGVQLRLPDLFTSDDLLGFGASISLPVSLNAEQEVTSRALRRPISVDDMPGLGSGTITLPMKILAGVSYQPSRLLLIATEGLYQGWSEYENDFTSTENQLFVDRYKLGLGFQYFPYITGSDKFLSNFEYRFGVSYDTGHLRLEGEQINTLMFSFGLGILSPDANSNSSIDIGFEYGIRGTERLVQEQIWGIRLSLNLAELFFFRPKLQ
ncbi:MAG TPA: hypothetical protein VFG39_04200 [Balneolaceae bacterium]|nr:hypothetical protein [Balneolaceae bacterium]